MLHWKNNLKRGAIKIVRINVKAKWEGARLYNFSGGPNFHVMTSDSPRRRKNILFAIINKKKKILFPPKLSNRNEAGKTLERKLWGGGWRGGARWNRIKNFTYRFY